MAVVCRVVYRRRKGVSLGGNKSKSINLIAPPPPHQWPLSTTENFFLLHLKIKSKNSFLFFISNKRWNESSTFYVLPHSPTTFQVSNQVFLFIFKHTSPSQYSQFSFIFCSLVRAHKFSFLSKILFFFFKSLAVFFAEIRSLSLYFDLWRWFVSINSYHAYTWKLCGKIPYEMRDGTLYLSYISSLVVNFYFRFT